MDLINNEALAGLRALIEGMLPEAPDPAHEPKLVFSGTRITPIGVGGFIAVNDDPKGAIYGRRIETGVAITAKAVTENLLEILVDNITGTLLSQDRQTLFKNGLCRIVLDGLGPVTTTGQGMDRVTARDVNFSVHYEYVRLPDVPEGVLDEIPLESDLDLSEGRAEFLINTGFDETALDLFDVVDDPLATLGGNSDWTYNADEFRIEQLGDIHGGDLVPTPDKAGTYLLLKQTALRPLVRNFILSAELGAGNPDGIGFVFRFLDTENFYYFLMSSRHNYRLMGKKVNGVFSVLDTPGLDDAQGFDTNGTYQLKLIVQDAGFTLFIDGDLALQGKDGSITEAARVGFACHGNSQAYFYRIKLLHFQN
ncbi:MAG: hypothetical protein GY737_11285 [Desulfobacteraceae bacterium]|nr:hypothetical protein [Desulfobacteraceae bacterium]